MRIPSGVVDQYIYFVAVDATDLVTRETGLTTFTVYRSRNGGAATAMTTPTVTEVDATNMPGIYKLLLDEDMTIDAGDDSQEVVLHITQASMAPVTRVFELYRPKITVGETLTVASSVLPWNAAWDAEVQSEAADALSAYDPPTNAEMTAAFAEIKGATWASTDTLEAIRDRGDAAWATATGFSTLDAAGVRTAVGLASANLDTQIGTLATAADLTAVKASTDLIPADPATETTLAAIAGYIDTEVAAILEDTGTSLPATLATLATSAQIAALNDLSAAEVNAEVVDALNTDTYAEPGQGAPAATTTLAAKINYLYKALRNKSEVTASQHSIYNDAGTTVDHKRSLADDGTTFSSGELASGP